ncbi:prostaglandin E2 receptor EP3 subtype isoform X3 [Anser cygnoides]|uniref:prostaglandin E2 receptor EP3 subtype isoform X3 n=1 Tax=Anser cygnoides TaxID=8845 RepID=UPI0034D2B1CF
MPAATRVRHRAPAGRAGRRLLGLRASGPRGPARSERGLRAGELQPRAGAAPHAAGGSGPARPAAPLGHEAAPPEASPAPPAPLPEGGQGRPAPAFNGRRPPRGRQCRASARCLPAGRRHGTGPGAGPGAGPGLAAAAMSRRPPCQGGPNGTEPCAMRPRGNGTGRAAEGCGAVSVAFPLTMMITGIVGNALAMLLVSRSYRAKENRRKRSFLLCIGSLALTDLAGQLLTSPIVISVYLSDRTWAAVDPSGRLCAFFGFSMTVFGLCPLFIASAMAVERTLAIRAPHWYASHMKTRMTKTALLGIWLAVVSFALLPIAGLGRYTLQWPGTWCFISTGDGELTGSFFASTFAGLGLFSLVVTVACNLATIEALVSRCRTKATAPRSSKQWGRITTETLIQLLGIMCVLSACWSPLLNMNTLENQ